MGNKAVTGGVGMDNIGTVGSSEMAAGVGNEESSWATGTIGGISRAGGHGTGRGNAAPSGGRGHEAAAVQGRCGIGRAVGL